MFDKASIRRVWLLAVSLSAFSSLAACSAAPAAPAVITLPAGSTPANASPRTIAVTGTADLLVAPDLFVVRAGVDKRDPDARAAIRAADDVIAAVLALTKELGIDEKDVQTEHTSLQPHYRDSWGGPVDVYMTSRGVRITARDPATAERLLWELPKRGTNRIDEVSLQSSKELEKRVEARTAAVQAARQKADSMATLLGQKLGRPLKVEEAQASFWSPATTNAAVNNGSSGEVGTAIAAGKIKVPATVSVTFELVDG